MHLPSTEDDEGKDCQTKISFYFMMIIIIGPPKKKSKRTPSAQPPIGQIQLSTDMVQQLDHWRQKIAARSEEHTSELQSL